MNIIPHPSPNHNARPAGVRPDLLLVHGTAGASAEGDVAWLCDEARKPHGGFYDVSLSYHYVIGRGGTVYRLVDEERRAWHAGRSHWQGRRDVNDFSIGVGLSNRGPEGGRDGGPEPYTEAQYDVLAGLAFGLRERWPIPWARILGHCDVSPGAKPTRGSISPGRNSSPGCSRATSPRSSSRRCRT